MNTERLLRLAEIAEDIDPAKFNMGNWMCDENCGTVGCVIGWATMEPDVIAAGLTMGFYGLEFKHSDNLFDQDIDAIRAYLDDNSAASYYLFMPMRYEDWVLPTYVAKCIRHVANGGRLPSTMSAENWTDIVTAD